MFGKKVYVYHYSATVIRQTKMNYLDGVMRLQQPLTNYEDGQYRKLKELICQYFNERQEEQYNPSQLTIRSLSFLGKFR